MHPATSRHSSSPTGFHDAPDDVDHNPAASFIPSADPPSSSNQGSPKQLLKSFRIQLLRHPDPHLMVIINDDDDDEAHRSLAT
jgi:hypothetical protein